MSSIRANIRKEICSMTVSGFVMPPVQNSSQSRSMSLRSLPVIIRFVSVFCQTAVPGVRSANAAPLLLCGMHVARVEHFDDGDEPIDLGVVSKDAVHPVRMELSEWSLVEIFDAKHAVVRNVLLH